jgi:hypothetical protein
MVIRVMVRYCHLSTSYNQPVVQFNVEYLKIQKSRQGHPQSIVETANTPTLDGLDQYILDTAVVSNIITNDPRERIIQWIQNDNGYTSGHNSGFGFGLG